MNLSLEQWDKIISPYLHRIEDAADIVGRRAGYLTAALNSLIAIPGWESRARGRLDYAEQQLVSALELVRKAKTVYDAKERIVENA